MKKYLAIDIGQVICHLDFNEFNRKLSNYAGITEEEAYNFIVLTQKSHDLGYSILEADLSNKIYGLNLKEEQVKDLMSEWHNSIKLNDKVMEWLKKLLSDGVMVALCSNIGWEHAELMKTLLGPIYNQTIKFFSCEAGCRKPTYLYFNLFLNMYPDFKCAVYMDDNKENIATGKLFKFHSILFDLSKMSDDEIINKLKEIEEEI